jgi:predicted ATP-grasp superfamily ATP-dependent carboligase
VAQCQPLENVPPVVIFSGGAEIVSVSILEAFCQRCVPVVLISLGRESLVRDVTGVIAHTVIDWPPENKTSLPQLVTFLKKIGAGNPLVWPIFSTEDGGSRFLIENADTLSPFVKIFGAKNLRMMGLDKAELFSFLLTNDCQDLIAETIVVEQADEITDIYKAWDSLLILKPAIKPIDVSQAIEGRGAKILSMSLTEPIGSFVERCRQYWLKCDRWLVQKKLVTPFEGEGLWWGIRRQDGSYLGMTAVERWKYPRYGGSGCWVETLHLPELHEKAERILSAIDFHGITEIPFLKDEAGAWKMLELNPRPWLQCALPGKAGFPLLESVYDDWYYSKNSQIVSRKSVSRKTWVNPERMILAVFSREYGSWINSMKTLVHVLGTADYWTIYSSPWRRIKFRWLARLIKKLFQ